MSGSSGLQTAESKGRSPNDLLSSSATRNASVLGAYGEASKALVAGSKSAGNKGPAFGMGAVRALQVRAPPNFEHFCRRWKNLYPLLAIQLLIRKPPSPLRFPRLTPSLRCQGSR